MHLDFCMARWGLARSTHHLYHTTTYHLGKQHGFQQGLVPMIARRLNLADYTSCVSFCIQPPPQPCSLVLHGCWWGHTMLQLLSGGTHGSCTSSWAGQARYLQAIVCIVYGGGWWLCSKLVLTSSGVLL